jgi:hypothetical protein
MSETAGHSSAEALETQQIDQQLRETQDRLIQRYASQDGISAEQVRTTFESCAARKVVFAAQEGRVDYR